MTNTTNNALTNDEIADLFNDVSGCISHYRDCVAPFHHDRAKVAEDWLDDLDSGEVMAPELAKTALELLVTFTSEPEDDYVDGLCAELNDVISMSWAPFTK